MSIVVTGQLVETEIEMGEEIEVIRVGFFFFFLVGVWVWDRLSCFSTPSFQRAENIIYLF